MIKPPVESLLFQATARMLRWLLVIALCVLIPTVGASLAREYLLPRPVASTGYVPELGYTTDGTRAVPPIYVLYGALPPPGPNQKRSGSCNPKAAQIEINGGCWVRTDTPPPCPEGFQWEHEHRCWLPVARAAPVPTSGDSAPVTIAE